MFGGVGGESGVKKYENMPWAMMSVTTGNGIVGLYGSVIDFRHIFVFGRAIPLGVTK